MAAIAAPTLYRPASGAGVTNPPGTLERPIPVDPEPARRAARIVGVAGFEEAGAEVARERVHGPADDRDPGFQPERIGRGLGQAADDAPHRGARREPVGRDARRRDRSRIGHELVRDERGGGDAGETEREPLPGREVPARRRRDAGSWRSTQSAAGRPPSAQPRTPVASASSSASAVARVSRNVIAGRVASPRASTATSVGPCPSTPIATTSARSAARSARTALTTADHQAPGSCSAQPWPPDVEAVAAPRQRQQPAVEADETRLDLGRPEIEPEDGRFPGGHARTSVGRCERRLVEGDDGFGGGDVGDERPDDARPQRAEDRPDLALARRDPDRHREPAETSRIERDDALAQGRADEPAVEVERGDEDLADGVRRLEVALAWRRRAARDAPGRAADPEQRDVEPIPQVDDGPNARRARRAPVAWPRRRRAPAPSGRAPGRRARRRPAGTARAPGRSTSSRRTAGRP